jgi:hypothetical protein
MPINDQLTMFGQADLFDTSRPASAPEPDRRAADELDQAPGFSLTPYAPPVEPERPTVELVDIEDPADAPIIRRGAKGLEFWTIYVRTAKTEQPIPCFAVETTDGPAALKAFDKSPIRATLAAAGKLHTEEARRGRPRWVRSIDNILTSGHMKTLVIEAKPHGAGRGQWIEVFRTRAFSHGQAYRKWEAVGGRLHDYQKTRVKRID